MNQTKILIVTGLFPPEIGGPATYAKILSEELPAHGYEVKILPFSLVRKYPPIIRHLFFSYLIWRQAKEVDIIYAMDPVSVGWPTMIACFFSKRTYWLKIVGDYAWEQGQQRFGVADSLDDFSAKKNGYAWPVIILKKIQLAVARRAKKIIVPSQYLKKIVGENWGIDPKKIEVIYNAFDGREIILNQAEARQELNLAPTDKILISVGRLVPWKGFSTLIELMPEIQKIDGLSSTKLLIVGDGPEKDNLNKKIVENHLTPSVMMLGRLDQTTLFKYLRAADLFILNTAYEGFSHQLLEVMSLGTIALVTKIGGNPELIKNEEQLFEYDNQENILLAIKKILLGLTETEQQMMIEAGRTIAASFTRDRMVKELVNLFQTNENS